MNHSEGNITPLRITLTKLNELLKSLGKEKYMSLLLEGKHKKHARKILLLLLLLLLPLLLILLLLLFICYLLFTYFFLSEKNLMLK